MYRTLLIMAFAVVASANNCEPVSYSMCLDVGYDMTKFPNSLGHDNQEDAKLQLQTFTPLIQYGCSKQLKEFLCLVYIPKCDPRNPQDPIASPKRKLCVDVRTKCLPVLHEFGFPWPSALACDTFPEDETVTTTSKTTVTPSDVPTTEAMPRYQLSIKYYPTAITVVSCCQFYTYTKKEISIPIETDICIKSGDLRSSSIPRITWKRSGDIRSSRITLKSAKKHNRIWDSDYATLIVVTGYSETTNTNIYVNWMVTNIRYGHLSSGITVHEYEGPQPNADSDNKVYFFLYMHAKPVNVFSVGKYTSPENSRKSMDFKSFTTENNMIFASSKYIFVDMDAYSRYRMVKDFGKSEAKVCSDVPDYPRICARKLNSNPTFIRK